MTMTAKPYPIQRSWLDSRGAGTGLVVLYCALAVAPVLVARWAAPPTQEPWLVQLALALGLTGFSLVCLQVLLAGRFRTLDRPFGLDRVMKFHANMAKVALGMLLLHPVLLAAGHGSVALFGLQTSWRVYLGKAALLLLVLGVLFALYFYKLKVDYNAWRFAHKGMIAVVVLAFLHGLVISRHIQASRAVKGLWIAFFLGAAGVYAYRNALVPFRRRRFRVTEVQGETHDTFTLSFEPQNGPSLHWHPGQFMFLKLVRPGRPSETHPFTISASPLETGKLQATIKQSGNFTNTIGQTKTGDIARVEGAFGRFSYVYHEASALLFIAGGIGVTPIMSMIRCLRDSGDRRPVVLLHGNQTRADRVFADELAQLPEHFKTVHILAEPDESWQGERGYITADLIEKHAGGILDRAHVYLCGPPAMMEALNETLAQLQVDGRRIHQERFAL